MRWYMRRTAHRRIVRSNGRQAGPPLESGDVQSRTGDFGLSDLELGHHSAAAKKLQHVAPRTGDRLHYVYGFGDNEGHDIIVENVLNTESRPARVAGRRRPAERRGLVLGWQALDRLRCSNGLQPWLLTEPRGRAH
jgi:hypothetical protein